MAQTLPDRTEVEGAIKDAIAAVDQLYTTRQIHANGELAHTCLLGSDALAARKLLPLFSGTHLGRLILENVGLIGRYR